MRQLARFLSSLTLLLLCGPLPAAHAEDIDLFIGGGGGSTSVANVMIVLDNTSNWSANNQGWPGGITQGQAEVQALSQVISTLDSSINVGLTLLTTTAGNPGGVVVFDLAPMTAANQAKWASWLTARYNNITDPTWKAASSANYGAVMFDMFKYFGGFTSPAHATDNVAGSPVARSYFGNARYADIDTSIADPSAYTNGFSLYKSPSLGPCPKNYIVFIGNGFPNADDPTLLSNVQGNTSAIAPNPMDGGNKSYTADEWARFLYTTDVSPVAGQQNVITYTVNVFGTKPPPNQPEQRQYLYNMAVAGGGTPFTAQSSSEVLSALQKIFVEVQAVNGTFASASLPINTTNRAQDKNQVFIPQFRPDPDAKPRWYGNLKQYQLIDTGGTVQLGDVNGEVAVNSQTGFLTDCATSFWTTDSGSYSAVTGAYWATVPGNPIPRGKCTATTFNAFSDAPDGPIVEKGGVAEVIRKGNNPPSTNTTPTWQVNRTLYTQSGSGLVTFDTTSSGLSASLVNFISGKDVNDENGNSNVTETRPSLHGDALHSRPLPVDYGSSVTVYYGTNDGMLRAVNATTGAERWAFVAPEFFSRLQRLSDNSPLISNYFADPTKVTPTPVAKDYFFDGSIGLYQAADNSKVWIYPTMRRGGRMLYAFNVTNPASPSLMWKVGCPSLANDTGCSSGFSGIGQTWSKPAVATGILGYSKPVLIVGGGYDNCEDANTSSPNCGNTKGAAVYVIDAQDGTLIKSFSTSRSVAADVALIATAGDGVVDHAYAVDTGGNIYRIDFAAQTSNWSMKRVAYTNGAGRKFMYAPALLVGPNSKVYLALTSGDREHPLVSQYPYANVTNRMYVYLDDLTATSATNLDDTAVMGNFTSLTTCNTTGVLPTSTQKGWFMDLNQNGAGEQGVTSAVIAGGMVAFSTNRPVPPAQNSCSTTLGEARGYWVNLFNGSGAIGVQGSCGGSRSSVFASGGLPPSPVIGTVPINGVPQTVIIGASQRAGGANSPIAPQKVAPTVTAKRKTIYWKSSAMQ
ncbi:type IV pilus assembly protein PilY1 [Noviherbaspirillum humi]|uniref:Type IV pilus assembly protein PilY1 n=1 Tax=Noviherbaspirillum humi TaxID=1688639 RepID=A0A239DMK6_9BURK|nr:PilC/PilY family type IV pilus protein [Noviherbaspirillum humi]SNS32914.1 type IV pilus assembly protein PilY1 [Noviherbaspirillum humi]